MSLDIGYDLPSRLILSMPPVLMPDFSAGWNPINSTLAANALTAPDGTNTGGTLTATGASFAAAEPVTFSMLGGVVYAISCYIKSAAGVWALQGFTDGVSNGCYTWFDANGGVAGTNSPFGTGSFVSSKIVAAANGWFLATSFIKISATIATMLPVYACVNANGGVTSTGAQVVNMWHPTRQPLT